MTISKPTLCQLAAFPYQKLFFNYQISFCQISPGIKCYREELRTVSLFSWGRGKFNKRPLHYIPDNLERSSQEGGKGVSQSAKG